MIDLDDRIARDYLADSREHLASAEEDLLALERLIVGPDRTEQSRTSEDDDLVRRIFRAVHQIKGGAIYFDLLKILQLANQIEDVLTFLRTWKVLMTPARVTVLLRALDCLQRMFQDPGRSNEADTSGIEAALAELRQDDLPQAEGLLQAAPSELRVLLVEDDAASRLLLQAFLSRYGECNIAVNGKEAVEAVGSALRRGQAYQLICMDIMMPEMNGREAVRRIRAMEEDHGILSTRGAKIIMTTTISEISEVILCFWELCDAYLMKPIDLNELLGKIKSFHLIDSRRP